MAEFKLIIELFLEQVRDVGQRPALVLESGPKLSYASLHGSLYPPPWPLFYVKITFNMY